MIFRGSRVVLLRGLSAQSKVCLDILPDGLAFAAFPGLKLAGGENRQGFFVSADEVV